jgi:hypothetical protein
MSSCCDIASNILALQIKGSVVHGSFITYEMPHLHAWVEKNGFIIDVTVEQFNLPLLTFPKILRVSKKSNFAKKHYRVSERFPVKKWLKQQDATKN